jgi:uncharacterized protein YqjF (DUF2071 family)
MLDTYRGVAYVSIVGFRFLQTRVLGFPVPWHRDFEEVNLRFYVRRFAGDDWRRGVVFLREIVSKPAITAVARLVYHEKYVTWPMRHRVDLRPDGAVADAVSYEWESHGAWHGLRATADNNASAPREPAPGSLEEFITEHYWGYVRQRNGGTVEYAVEHPRWGVVPARDVALSCDVARHYGEAFVPILGQPPQSAFIATGSAVTVFRGVRLPPAS